jgi:cytochrome P450
MIADRSFLSPTLVKDPHPYLHELRAAAPVHWSECHHAWILTRHDDVASAFLDERLSAARVRSLLPIEPSVDDRRIFDAIYRLLGSWMVFTDNPDHARLRRLARAAFTGRMIERLRPTIAGLVDGLIDELARERRVDFVRRFAFPLPATVIANLLGVPAEDLGRFKEWSEDVAALVFGGAGGAQRRDRALRGLLALESYFRDLLERFRRAPADNLLTELARAEEKGDVLSADEVIATCVLLLFAGHETTANLLGTSVFHLDRHPDARRRLAEDPGLAPRAVEELLRFDGPTKMQVRLATEDLELRGKRIRSGQRVLLCQSAANRDPERFSDPDRLDLDRTDDEHLAFGIGIHFCLGAPLARLEAEIALRAIAERLPELRVTTDDPPWQATILSRGLAALPVVVRSAPV